MTAGYEPRPSTLHFDLGISSVYLGWASTTIDIDCCIEHRTWSSKHCTRLDLIIREETTDRLTIFFGIGIVNSNSYRSPARPTVRLPQLESCLPVLPLGLAPFQKTQTVLPSTTSQDRNPTSLSAAPNERLDQVPWFLHRSENYLDGLEVGKQVLSAVVAGDEAKAFLF